MLDLDKGTWRELLEELLKLSEEELEQKIQVMPNNPDETVATPLLPAYAFGTVEELVGDPGDVGAGVRSFYDNQHHPGDFILCVDRNHFGEDGAVATDLLSGRKIFYKGVPRQFTYEQIDELLRHGFETFGGDSFRNPALDCLVFIRDNKFYCQTPGRTMLEGEGSTQIEL